MQPNKTVLIPTDALRRNLNLPAWADEVTIRAALRCAPPAEEVRAAAPTPRSQLESDETFFAREFPDVAASLGYAKQAPAAIPAQTDSAASRRRMAELAYRPPSAAEARTEAAGAFVRAMTDQELAAVNPRQPTQVERDAAQAEAEHRRFMTDRFSSAAKAAGYTPKPFDIAERRPVEGKFFSH